MAGRQFGGKSISMYMCEDLSSNLQHLHKSQALLHMSITPTLEDGNWKIWELVSSGAPGSVPQRSRMEI